MQGKERQDELHEHREDGNIGNREERTRKELIEQWNRQDRHTCLSYVGNGAVYAQSPFRRGQVT